VNLRPPAAALKRYPNDAVTAPFSNLPPPATLARPPVTPLMAAPPMRSPMFPSGSGKYLAMTGSTAAPPAADRAPLWHDPPDALEERHPTPAWLAILKRCASDPNASGPCPPNEVSVPGNIPVNSPAPQKASAVAVAIAPAFNTSPILPPESPVTIAAPAAAAMNGPANPMASAPPGPNTAVSVMVIAICRIERRMGIRWNTVWKKCVTLWKALENQEKPLGSVNASGSLPT